MSSIFVEINVLEDSTNEILFNGDILVDEEDGWFEGMSNSQEEMVFGVFQRLKAIQIYSLNKNTQINSFYLSRPLFTYSGLETSHDGKKLSVKMIVHNKDRDPRDMDNSEKENFSNQLTEFKQNFLTGKKRELYNKYYSKRKEISEMVKEKMKNEISKNSIKLIKNNDERI